MFENPKDFLIDGKPLAVNKGGSPTERDEQIATVALLALMAQADNEFTADEFNAVIASMEAAFALPADEAAETLESANFLIKEKERLNEFVEIINQNFNESQKERVLSLVWKVLLTNDQVDSAETTLAVDLRKRLGLTLEQAVRARQLAQLYESDE